MKRKILITLGVLLAVLVVFIVIFAAVFDLDETINARKAEMLPQLEQRLGRGIEIGEVRTTLLPVLGAEIRDVVIKGRTPDEPPLLRIARVRFAVGLWTAIKSLGKEVRLDALIIDGLTLELIREADGRLSYEDVLARLSEGPPPDEAPKPLDPEVRRIIQNAELRRVALENSRLRLIDKATGGAPAETFINDLLIEVDDVKLSQPFEVHVAASVFADRPNFDLRVALGPVPIGQENAAVPIDKVALQAEGIDLSRLTPYLGPGAPASIHSATFGANLTVDDPLGSRGGIAVKGELHVGNLALGTPKPGQAFTLDVAPNLVIDPVEGVIDLTGFRLALDKMTLTADGRIEGLLAGRPTFKGVMLKTADFDFTRLFALLPDARAALPPGMELGGPFALDVKAEGDPDAQDIQLAVDLDGARLLVPEALDKPAGAALHANLDAHLTRDSVDLKDLALALGPLALNARGTVRNFAQPVFNVKGGTGDTPIDGLARLLPAVRAAVPADVQ
ncbi:MAG: DUF748 domain-containing protein, partial [Myxococcales bacterium]|nr:DUF748 domain-containing protein [Myxococcales bacterium]